MLSHMVVPLKVWLLDYDAASKRRGRKKATKLGHGSFEGPAY